MTTVIVSGPIANKPGNGGIVWNELSYVLGLQRLGFDVHFWEEVAEGSCVAPGGSRSELEDSENLRYFRQVTQRFGLAGRAALIYAGGAKIEGADMAQLRAVAEDAALLVNINGHLRHPDLRSLVRRAVYIDEDPGYTQFWHAARNSGVCLEGHDRFYTVGANIGTAECSIPCGGVSWQPIRQPVVLEEWPSVKARPRAAFTTVGSWRGAYGPVEFQGRNFGLKAHEFRKFSRLPAVSQQDFEIALDIDPADEKDRRALLADGWRVLDPRTVAADPDHFRAYLQISGAEFSVAQGIYVDTNSGWFSDRSARYLASGRPVLVQDTGLSRGLPAGEGLLTFRTLEEAVEGAAAIARDYAAHAEAAREIAEAFFDSDKVLGQVLDEVGVRP